MNRIIKRIAEDANEDKVTYRYESYEFTVDYSLGIGSYESEQEADYIVDGMRDYLGTEDVEQAEFERDKVTFYNSTGEVVAVANAE